MMIVHKIPTTNWFDDVANELQTHKTIRWKRDLVHVCVCVSNQQDNQMCKNIKAQ